MSTHNIHFHKKPKIPLYIIVSLSYQKNFLGTQKRVRSNHGKRAIHFRGNEVLLYMYLANLYILFILLKHCMNVFVFI